MLGGVIELVAMTAVDTPALKALYACVNLLNKKIQDEAVLHQGASARWLARRWSVSTTSIETANINSSILTDVEQ